MTLDRAVEVFVRGFAWTRSQTFPYVVESHGDWWRMADDPSRTTRRRGCEWVAVGSDPGTFVEYVEPREKDRHALCLILPPGVNDAGLRRSMRSLGYRLQRTEAMFVHYLGGLSPAVADGHVRRVLDGETAEQLALAAGARQIHAYQIDETPPVIRQYVASQEGEIVGWVRSIAVDEAAWCSNLYVRPEHRRKGLATALMARMLLDDHEYGFVANVLLASHAGAHLYPQLGYQQIGRLYLYRRQGKERSTAGPDDPECLSSIDPLATEE